MRMTIKDYIEAAIIIAAIGVLNILHKIKQLLEPKP
jgi:hypothetical protein